MPTPPSSPAHPSIPVAPLTGADWLSARASLASRRTRRFTRLWSALLGPLALIALLVPLASRDPGAAQRASRADLVRDTVTSAQRVQRATRELAAAESLLAAARSVPPAVTGSNTAVAQPPVAIPQAPAAQLPTGTTASPVAVSLDLAIREARRLRTPAAWLAVADEPPVRDGPRMRALAESLSTLAERRDALASSPSRDQQAAPLTATISRLGYTILAIAENRRADIAGVSASGSPVPLAIAPTDTPPPAARSGTSIALPGEATAVADIVGLTAQVAVATDSLTRATTAHAAARARLESATTTASSTAPEMSTLAAVTPALGLLALLVIGLGFRFTTALNREMNAPTIAHAQEAERAIGATVLASVRDAQLDGPARFRPSGVDPFRMLYLGLTATGTRARTMIVTGSDPVIVAAVGARLAISAAADHRATLIIDLDPQAIALSRTFRERAEPGLNDALAGAFKWREIACPVGSSDGLPITLIPAGTERDDLPSGESHEQRREELTKFRSAFDFTILVAPGPYVDRAISLVESSPLVLSASVGETRLDAFAKEGATLKSGARRLHGIVLWDAPRPTLPTRADLAALLSKRKGRTPGGSFAAVQRAIGKEYKGQ